MITSPFAPLPREDGASKRADIRPCPESYSGATVRRFPLNRDGRDFVVGDLHGSYGLLWDALVSIGFSFGRDRLFCVGDLADRGRRSTDVVPFLRWLDKGGGGSVRGNHEAMLVDLYAGRLPAFHQEQAVLGKNGMSWLLSLELEQRIAVANAFAALPLAIEIESPGGIVGIVHADVPHRMSWGQFISILDQGKNDDQFPDVVEFALWSRLRIERGIRRQVAGIDAVFVGHSMLEEPFTLGNVHFIDTGAVCGDLAQDSEFGVLTMVETTAIAPGHMASFSVATYSRTFLPGRGLQTDGSGGAQCRYCQRNSA
ncbi:MAG: metallophosphoesterase [Acidobacteriota bacterium]